MLMTTTIKHIVLFSCCLFATVYLQAQHTDGAAWLYTGVNAEVAKDLDAEAGQEIRYNVSVSDLYQWNSHASLTYKFTKKIKVSGDYRYSVRSSGNTHRVGFGIGLREGFGDLDLAYRSKIQYSTAADGNEGSVWRNKGTVSYTLNKDWETYGSGELFYNLSNEGNALNGFRSEIGIDYSPNKHHDLTASWIYDMEFQVSFPEKLHVLNLSYIYNW